MASEILLQIFISLVTSILTWTALLFGQKIVIPWYEGVVYRGLKVDGKWQATIDFDHTVRFHEEIEIEQNGHNLKGAYSIKNEFTEDKESSFSTYALTGKIINNHVTFTALIKSQKAIGIASFILEITDGGEALEGKSIWVNRIGNQIQSIDYKLNRIKN